MRSLSLHVEGDTVALNGEMTFSTVTAALNQSNNLFGREGELQVDLKGVARVDSAGVSLLLEWFRRMEQQRRKISFLNVPHALQRLARIGGVATLLSIDAER